MEYKCKICGETEESSHWIDGEEMLEKEHCFDCHYWLQCHEDDITNRKDHKYVIENGTHYIIEPEDSKETYFRGFGGAKVKIKFFDGTEVISTNLWYQGPIPERFRDIMPDNGTIEWIH